MATLSSRDKVVDNWGQIIENGAGRDTWILDKTEVFLKEANMPNVEWRREQVSSGMFGEKRTFLIGNHKALREYTLYIGARNFGVHLEVSWFLTVSPGFLKRAVSKKLTMGNPFALSENMSIFAHEDLASYKSVAARCVERACHMLMDELNLDTSGLSTKGKGFLANW